VGTRELKRRWGRHGQTFRHHTSQVLVKESEGIPSSMIVKNLEESNLWAFYSGTTVARLPKATGNSSAKKRYVGMLRL
jgi:hypothetical protein